MHRSTTELSIDLDLENDEMLIHSGASEIHKQTVTVREVCCKMMETKLVLVLILSNSKVLVYECLHGFKNQLKEKFRFKLVQS